MFGLMQTASQAKEQSLLPCEMPVCSHQIVRGTGIVRTSALESDLDSSPRATTSKL